MCIRDRNNLERQVNGKKISTAESNAALKLIDYTVSLEEFNEVDLVIEAATENEPIKQKILNSLLPHIQPHTILTSNTSSISITRLASCTDRPEKFMGFHFMNPVPVMQLVELIKGIASERVGTPSDVAALVEFLTLSEPCFVTGQDIIVDGFQWNR